MVEKVEVRSWRDLRREALARGDFTEAEIAAERRELLAEVRSCRLAELRNSRAWTQAEVADAMGVAQPRVSQIENGDIEHSELMTLRCYIEALGGSLHVVADFGDQTITIE